MIEKEEGEDEEEEEEENYYICPDTFVTYCNISVMIHVQAFSQTPSYFF